MQSDIKCPQCGLEVSALSPVDSELADRLRRADPGAMVPASACKSCIAEMRKGSSGGFLLAEAKAKESHKLNMWKSRVQFVKSGRTLMEQKMFSDAAIQYEKYIRLLEMVFEVEKGGLKPENFKDKARTQELTVICSVYWDLLRIYDTNDVYRSRQDNAAEQLAKFAPYTPIFPDIVKKAEVFAKTAKNPGSIKNFVRLALRQRPRCFIATSVFDSTRASEVLWLRAFRDRHLKSSPWGRKFVRLYYKVSPGIARRLDQQNWLKPALRILLRGFIRFWNCLHELSMLKQSDELHQK